MHYVYILGLVALKDEHIHSNYGVNVRETLHILTMQKLAASSSFEGQIHHKGRIWGKNREKKLEKLLFVCVYIYIYSEISLCKGNSLAIK